MLKLVDYAVSSSDEADLSENCDEDADDEVEILDDSSIIPSILKGLIDQIVRNEIVDDEISIGSSTNRETPTFIIEDRRGNSRMKWRQQNEKIRTRRKRKRDEISTKKKNIADGGDSTTTDWSDLDSWSSDSTSTSSSSDDDVARRNRSKSATAAATRRDAAERHEFSEDSDYVYACVVLESRKLRQRSNAGANVRKPTKTPGELDLDDLPPIENLRISIPIDANLRRIGVISSIVDKLVVVQSDYGLPPLDVDSWLVDENRRPIGQIFETFGPVPRPFYSLRFNRTEDARELLTNGQKVFFVPDNEEFTHPVFSVDALRRLKGSDASWEDNNEPPVNEMEFSDDEEERQFRAARKAARRAAAEAAGEDGGGGEQEAIAEDDEEESNQHQRRPMAKPRRRGTRGGFRGARGGASADGGGPPVTNDFHGHRGGFRGRYQRRGGSNFHGQYYQQQSGGSNFGYFPPTPPVQNPWASYDQRQQHCGGPYGPMFGPPRPPPPPPMWPSSQQQRQWVPPPFRVPFPPPPIPSSPFRAPVFNGPRPPPPPPFPPMMMDTRYLQK